MQASGWSRRWRSSSWSIGRAPYGVALTPGHVALATAIGVAGILAIFTVERVRWAWAVVFAVGWGCVAGLVTWWSGPLTPAGEFLDWRTACLFLSIAIAAPLFQTARDAGGRRFDYAEVHGHVWTNIVLFGAACAFAGIAFALAYLLAELFRCSSAANRSATSSNRLRFGKAGC